VRRRHTLVVIAALLVIAGGAFLAVGHSLWSPLLLQMTGPRTVADVVARYGADARVRLRPHFAKARVAYPPKDIALLVFKREKRFAVWARNDGGAWRFIRNYPILAASGVAGPKLREGDSQVPEGVYRIEHLNPNSSYHLSMKVSYPNAFDRRMAKSDGRTRLGGDIFIHGKNVSIGCVALGDRAIEELFTLVAETGHSRVKVIIAPHDVRGRGASVPRGAPSWTAQLYQTIAAALVEFPVWAESDSAIDVRGMTKGPKPFK
jgi:L,D-transpeptidase-like protein